MISRNDIKLLRSLRQKKYRQQTNLFFIEGFRLLEEALLAAAPVQRVFLAESHRNSDLHRQLVEFKISPSWGSESTLQQISDTRHTQGCLATVAMPPISSLDHLPPRLLILDRPSDPGNLGTLMRAAAWFGLKMVALSPQSADPYNPKVLRAGMGAHFHLFLLQSNLEQLLRILKQQQYRIFGGVMNGHPQPDDGRTSPEKWALLLGSEVHGIAGDLQDYITDPLTIEGSGNLDSLNLTVAGGILLSRLCRQ